MSLRVPILLASTRRGRRSEAVARWVHDRARGRGLAGDLLDLAEIDLPMLEERLHKRDDAPPALDRFATRIASADGLVIVTPEYSGGYPGVLKNAIDHLKDEFRRLPVGIATVSSATYGGMNCLAQLRHVLLCLGAMPVPARLMFTEVQRVFDADGCLQDDAFGPRADRFLDEVAWVAGAVKAHGDRRSS